MENIIKKRIKPDLTVFSTSELEKIIKEYNNYYNDDIFEKKINNSRDELEKIIYDLWRNYKIVDDNNNVIDCSICLQPIINSDNLTLNCNHILHSSCLLNYIYTNISSNCISNNIFRCPKCRKYLTNLIDEKKNNGYFDIENNVNYNNNNNNTNINIDNNSNNNNNSIGIDLITGLWIENNIENNIVILSNYSSDDE